MPEIMLRSLDEKYLSEVITAMSSEIKACSVTLLRSFEFQGELDLERLIKAAEITGKGFTKENLKSHLKGALAPFLDSKVLELDDTHRKERTGYRFNDDGYNDLAAAVNVAYDITNKLMTGQGEDRLKKSIPYILGTCKNPLLLVRLAEQFIGKTSMFQRDIVTSLQEFGIPRPTLNNQVGLLEGYSVLKSSKEPAEVEFEEHKRHERHERKIRRTLLTLTQAGQEVFRYFRDLKLFLRADPQFFPRQDRIEALKGNYLFENKKRILYVGISGDRTEKIVAEIKERDWDIDIYRMLLEVEGINSEKFSKLSAERLNNYDLVILDGYCQNGRVNSMVERYNLLKSQQASNGITAILLTPNTGLADSVEKKSPINYIFITDNHGNLDPIKLQEIMYKLMVNQKSVKKAQFDCSLT